MFENKELANNRKRPLNKTPSEIKHDFDDDWEDDAGWSRVQSPMWRMRDLTTKPGYAASKSDELSKAS